MLISKQSITASQVYRSRKVYRLCVLFILLLCWACMGYARLSIPSAVKEDTVALQYGKQQYTLLRYQDQLLVVDPNVKKNVLTVRLSEAKNPYFICTSPDRQWFIYSSKTDRLSYVYDLRTGTLKNILPFLIESAVFSTTGSRVYLLHSKSILQSRLAVYDVDSWRPLIERSVNGAAEDMALNQKETKLLFAVRSVVQVVDTDSLIMRTADWEDGRLRLLTFHPIMDELYASVNQRNAIEIRDLATKKKVLTVSGHDAPITKLAYSPDGQHLISLDANGYLYTWDIEHRRRVAAFSAISAFEFIDNAFLWLRKNQIWEKIAWDALYQDKYENDGDYFFSDKQKKKLNIVPRPIFAYTKETNLVLGVGVNLVFNNSNPKDKKQQNYFRPSTLTPHISYGFNGQFNVGLNADYFNKDGWHFINTIQFLNNNRSFYFGYGHDADRDDRMVYYNDVFSLAGTITKSFNPKMFIGVKYHFRKDNELDFGDNKAMGVPNVSGGFLGGAGIVLQYDNRNDVFFPTTGRYINLSYTHYGNWLRSDFTYQDVEVDYRSYRPLGILTNGTTLAFQALYQGVFGNDAPFYQLPYLAADRIIRGVWRNLYIDKQAIALQAELRAGFSNLNDRYGFVVFMGLGDVTDDFLKHYSPKPIGVLGLGLRQQLIPRLKLQSRIDASVNTRGDLGVLGGIGLSF